MRLGSLEPVFRAARWGVWQGFPWQLPEVFCLLVQKQLTWVCSSSRSLATLWFKVPSGYLHWWHISFHCGQCSWASGWMGEPGLGEPDHSRSYMITVKIMWNTHTQHFTMAMREPWGEQTLTSHCNRRGGAGLYSKSPKLETTQIAILNRTHTETEVHLHALEYHMLMKMNKVQIKANLV